MSAGVIVISESEDESIPTASKRSRCLVSDSDSSNSDSDVMITSVEPGHASEQLISYGDSTSSDEDVLPDRVKVMDTSKSPVKVKPEVESTATELSRLHDLKELPVYAQPNKMLTTQEAVSVLLSSELQESSICTKVPFSVEINAVFIVDLNKLASPNDVLCDDMGVWTWGGSSKRWISVDSDGFIIFLKKSQTGDDESCYLVWKRYYNLKSSPDVKRMIIILEDHCSDVLNLALVQYHFSQGEHQLKIAPHGNAHSGQSYVRTMPSVMCKLKKEAKKKTPKRALQFVSQEAGGIMEATSAGALPRSRQQIKDARRKFTSKQEYDPLYSVMYMCKEGEGTGGDTFVRMVNAAPFPMMLISFDYTLDDLVRFCTSPTCFSILGVDPTFNLGDFDVTITTYRHLLLHPRGNSGGKPPVMVGPIFIHVRKDFSTYHFFSSSLVGQRRQLSSLQAFGTDGELALETAFAATFPQAQHVRCFLHFRGNVERKLQELGVPRSVSDEIVKDIMGSPTQLQHGLVDTETAEKLDDMLSGLKRRWNEFEKPYNTPPYFHSWFVKHCRDNVANYMLQDVREKAGLGSPPSPYYTNEVESKNKLLKEEVQYKSSQLPEFVEKMKKLMEGQRQEVERAIIGSGEFRLRKEYHYLAVESSKWFKMSTEQRQRKIDRFMKAAVQVNLPSSCSCPLDTLSLPSQLKESLWEKANELAKDETAIVRAPGDGDESAWMVKSYSGKRPHFVKITKCTFACDEQCLSYKSMKLCSHTIALAIKKGCMDRFLKWYRTMKYQPNFTILAEAGKPSTTGKKPTRKGVSKKGAELVKKLVADAEESNSTWQLRGRNFGEQVTFTDDNPFECDSSLTSRGPSPASLQGSPHSVSLPATTATLVMSRSDVHSINIGSLGGIVGGPPPLVPAERGHSVRKPSNSSFVLPHPSLNSNFTIPQISSNFMPSPNSNVLVAQPSFKSSFVVSQPSPNSNFAASSVSPQQQRPCVDAPFWLVFIFGNVSRCNGCKGRISRGEDKKPLPPPDDIVLGHKEYIIYQNSKSGNYEQSRDKRNVYYHPWRTCIAPHFCDFDAIHHITVPALVSEKLLTVHKVLIFKEFGIHVQPNRDFMCNTAVHVILIALDFSIDCIIFMLTIF